MNYFDLNLRRLQTFVTVARLGSFTPGGAAPASFAARPHQRNRSHREERTLTIARRRKLLENVESGMQGVEFVNARPRFDQAK